MKRLTTNCPDNNLDAALNLFYIKDFETWVRGGGNGPDYPDIRLYDFIRKAAKILLPDLDFPMDDDGVDYAMGELLLDGPDEPTGLLALLYTAAWSYAELRGRLMQYEDTGLSPQACAEAREAGKVLSSCDISFGRLAELLTADKDGRLVVLPCKVGDIVWANLDGMRHTRKCVIEFANIGSHVTTIVFSTVDGLREQYGVNPCSFGKTVFLTREEAEKALEAMKNGN